MWLVHSTTTFNLKKILEDGEIKSSSETGINRYEENLPNVFMSVIFDDMKVLGKQPALIFFPIDIMASYEVSHWSSTWNYGEIFDSSQVDKISPRTDSDVSILYNDKISPRQNTEIWQEWFYRLYPQKMYKSYKMGTSGQMNEVIFNSSIPMGEASFIYLIKDKRVKFNTYGVDEVEIPDRIDNAKELNKLLGN
jgi:hypothetical protein